jgi:hypothetical protein
MKWKNTTMWAGLGLILALFVPAVLLVPRQALFKIMDAVCVASALALCFGYARTAWAAIRLPIRKVGLGQLLIVGLFVVCMALALAFGGLWAWRALGKPDWIADSITVALSRWLLGAGLLTALLINWTSDGRVTVASYSRTATLAAGATLLAMLLIWMGWG